jgi:hypothetical protein
MADPMGLDVSNIKVGTRTVIDPGTHAAVKKYVVSYMVGAHGPFEHEFTQAQYSQPNVTAAINAQVATLRAIQAAHAPGM